jgi:hypothetical protein
MENGITVDWVKNQLLHFQKEEVCYVQAVQIASQKLEKAKEEFVKAEERLDGIRGVIKEFEWQLNFYGENGRLP